tara:strand:+ start:150 stop:1286 length:1137 start_codon:yes stop_codon:yes gene_type:complete
MPKKTRILFLANTSWYLYNFKLPLFQAINNQDYDILLVAPSDSYSALLEDSGLKFIHWDLNRSSLNPFNAIYSVIKLIYIYINAKPDIVHHFTIKPCMYGSIAARLTNVNYVINAFTGLGQLYFMAKNKYSLIRFLSVFIYRLILSTRNSITVCQNKHDLHELERIYNSKIINSRIIPGSGVDTSFFKRNKSKLVFNTPPNILFPARLIKEKGYSELIQACYKLWDEGCKFNLIIAGSIDLGNNSYISEDELSKLKSYSCIKLLGHSTNMKNVYENMDIVVLPSWREGLSKSLIEAGSMECAIITTDVPGCKDIVDHGLNGLLVPVKDIMALKNSIYYLLNNNNLAIKLGKNAREKSELFFNMSLINKMTLDLYKTCI